MANEMTNRNEFNPLRREEILHRWRDARSAYESLMNATEDVSPWSEKELSLLAEADEQWKLMAQAGRDYFAELPLVTMSTCPFCEEKLVRSFDPTGFDGLWWRTYTVTDEPPACPHFFLLRGAVSYSSRRPVAPNFEVRPGPEVPYVIPAILEHESVVCVIGQIEMQHGATAYPLAYFTEEKSFPPEQSTSPWARTIYTYRTRAGEAHWRIPSENWDYDLAKWVERGHLRWCLQGTDNNKLNAGESCPYVDLPGRRREVVIRGNLVATWQTPERVGVWPTTSF